MTKPEQQNQSWGYRYFTLLAGVLAGVLVAGKAQTAYLPTVGPAPLRFRADYKPVVHIKLPPPTPTGQSGASAPTPTAPLVVGVPVPATQTNQTVVQPPAVVESPRPDGVVSPQMLLKYFSRSTNAADANAPLNFTPPPQPEPPSSRAEYSTPQH